MAVSVWAEASPTCCRNLTTAAWWHIFVTMLPVGLERRPGRDGISIMFMSNAHPGRPHAKQLSIR
jgi:hypothetical protein